MPNKILISSPADLKPFLDEQVEYYNNRSFIAEDPVSIPHSYSKKEDIEISGFLTATIAWGRRDMILKNARHLMDLLDDSPYEFVIGAKAKDYAHLNTFVHRTFNGTDLIYFLKSLKHVYRKHGGLEGIFTPVGPLTSVDMGKAITNARTVFFSYGDPGRSAKHFSNPETNAAAKRINMFLRWMVRRDRKGVDFGLWKRVSPSALCCPLDVHSGRVARELGLLLRKQDDWKAVLELTGALRQIDPTDPVKYDFALFGAGVNRN